MLERPIRACPDDLWDDRSSGPPFWHLAYHALFYLDFYLSDSPDSFQATAFHQDNSNFLREMPFPPYRVETPAAAYRREQLLEYQAYARERCARAIAELDAEKSRQRCAFPWLDLSIG